MSKQQTSSRSSCPRCGTSTCFAYKSGKCVILIDNNFGKRKCPFYKSQAQFERERDAADTR